MPSIERTAYPRFKKPFSPQELDELYLPTDREQRFVARHAHGERQRLTLLALLKGHQHLGYLPATDAIPDQIRRYLCSALALDESTLFSVQAQRSRRRYRHAIRAFLDVKPFSEGGEVIVREAVREAAYTMSDPADLINVAIEKLVQSRVELPAFSTLDRHVGHIRHRVHQALYHRMTAPLSGTERQRLDALLSVRPFERRTDFNRLKQSPGPATLTRMRQWAVRLAWLDNLLDTRPLLVDVAHSKVKQFAAQARALEVGDLLDIHQQDKRHALLICLLHQAQVETRDQLVMMLLKRMRRITKQAKERLRTMHEDQREITEEMVVALSQIVTTAASCPSDAELGRQVRHILEAYGGIGVLSEHYRLVSAYHNGNHLPLLWESYRTHRVALFNLVDLLDIRSATQDESLLEAVQFIQHYRTARRDYLHVASPTGRDLSLDFASDRWKAFVQTRESGVVVFKRRALEVCVFHYLAAGLRSGDLYVTGSEAFADYRAQLLAVEDCQQRLPAYCETAGLPPSAAAFVAQLRQALTRAGERADQAFAPSAQLRFDAENRPHMKRLPRQRLPEGLDAFEEALKARMPERHLLDILKHVQYWAGFTRHFGPPSGSDAKMSETTSRYLLTVFGYGCNLGAAQTARHAGHMISLRNLKRIHDQHVTTEKLEAALRDVIQEYTRFELPFVWGSGRAAIADGTHIALTENTLLGERHIRYGGYGGIAYQHISDTYIALFSHFIACGVWEAIYILDGLLKNKSELQPDTLHADTQGQAVPVFGLAYLLGIKLMPRMRTWKDVTFYRPERTTTYTHIDPLFRSPQGRPQVVDWALVERHWPDLMQVVLSIQAGNILPSMLLQKLGSHNRKNKLYRAFREVGRVVRTIFLLDYIFDPRLRQHIRAETMKIEAYHRFSDWLRFGGLDVTPRDPVEQEKRMKYLDLVANAVILSNVVDMTAAVHALWQEGYPVTQELLARMSPYQTEHIKRFGQYVLDMETKPEPLEPNQLLLADIVA